MNLSLRKLLRRSPVCVFCRDGIEAGAEQVTCPECGVVVHAECERSMLRCATLGCGGFARLASPALMTDAQRERLGELMRKRAARERERRGRPGAEQATLIGRDELGTLLEAEVLAPSEDAQRATARAYLEHLVRRFAPVPAPLSERLLGSLLFAAFAGGAVAAVVALVGLGQGAFAAVGPCAILGFLATLGLSLDLSAGKDHALRTRLLARDLVDVAQHYEEETPVTAREVYRVALRLDPLHPDAQRLSAFLSGAGGAEAAGGLEG